MTINLETVTSFKQAGELKKHLLFDDIDNLKTFIKSKTPYFILGKGSNSIINPESKKQTLIQLSANILPYKRNENILQLNAGMSISKALSICQKEGLSGLEFAAGVPATIGGMVAMNFGCWGSSVSDYIERVLILNENGDQEIIINSQCEFSYRHSIFQEKKWVIIGADFKLDKKPENEIKTLIQDNITLRLEKQPLRHPTYGSIFKNPTGHFAAKLIEETGLKGQQLGKLKLSEKHANFMINLGGATFQDIQNFIHHIQQKVQDKTGVLLEQEVKLLQ